MIPPGAALLFVGRTSLVHGPFASVPEQAFSQDQDPMELCLHYPAPTVSLLTGAPADTDLTRRWPVYDFETMRSKVKLAFDLMIADNIRILYSVHPTAVVFPVYRWALMLGRATSGWSYGDINVHVQEWERASVDLCQFFYRPRVLDLATRQSFSAQTIANWMDLSPSISELDALTFLMDRAT